MNTIILLLERDSAWSPGMWVDQQGGYTGSNGQVTVERNMEWISVVRDDEVLVNFDDLEMERLRTLVSKPIAYLIEWKGSSLLESLLKDVPPELHAAIDNDHGLIVPVREVAGKPSDSWVTAKRLP